MHLLLTEDYHGINTNTIFARFVEMNTSTLQIKFRCARIDKHKSSLFLFETQDSGAPYLSWDKELYNRTNHMKIVQDIVWKCKYHILESQIGQMNVRWIPTFLLISYIKTQEPYLLAEMKNVLTDQIKWKLTMILSDSQLEARTEEKWI